MKISEIFSFISPKTFLIVFVLVFFFFGLHSLTIKRDIDLVEQRKSLKKNQLDRIIELKNLYLAKKKEIAVVDQPQKQSIDFSLTMIEGLVKKNFISGRIKKLQHSTLKRKDDEGQAAIDVSVNDAALEEVIAFTEAVKTRGLSVKRLRLYMPEEQKTTINMELVVVAAGGV